MNNTMFDYNYVIIGSSGYYYVGYHDLINLPGVRYFSSHHQDVNLLVRILEKLTFSKKVNKLVKEPFSNIVFKKIYPFHFSNVKPLCFLVFGDNQFLYYSSYLEYLTKVYPNAVKVLYLQDIVSKSFYSDKDVTIQMNKFDLVLSYDKGDSLKYGLKFYPTPFSNYNVDSSSFPSCDVYYCGSAKSRFSHIINVYKRCTDLGLKCIFFITDVPLDMQQKGDGICYNTYISYEDNLKYLKNSKCILEVMQDGADGYTPRLWESIMYDKHLLTNNSELTKSSFFYQLGQHNLEDGLSGIGTWINCPIEYSQELKKSLSPINLLKFIDEELKML